ncbi:MAG: Crp/Fnr family transcriptional regulator [Sphingomonadales bacterium]
MDRTKLEKRLTLLKRASLFSSIEESKLKLLAFTADDVHFAKGDVLFRQGVLNDEAYILAEGTAEAVWKSPTGARVIAILERFDVVGEIALLSDVPRMTTVTATSPITALRIEKEVFVRLIEEYPRIAVAIIRELAKVIHRTTRQLSAASAALQDAAPVTDNGRDQA